VLLRLADLAALIVAALVAMAAGSSADFVIVSVASSLSAP